MGLTVNLTQEVSLTTVTTITSKQWINGYGYKAMPGWRVSCTLVIAVIGGHPKCLSKIQFHRCALYPNVNGSHCAIVAVS